MLPLLRLWIRMKTLLAEDRGAQLLEYGVLAVLIAAAAVVVVSLLGQATAGNFTAINPGFEG